MILYLAALHNSNFSRCSPVTLRADPNIRSIRETLKYKLESYHYLEKGNTLRRVKEDGDKIFLDSGAFSAFTQGVRIPIEQYAEFCHEHKDNIHVASVLDEIGDHKGTWENQQKLEALGVNVLPCYHYGEPFEVADYYVANYPYITIGGMVPIPNGKLEPWLDELWHTVLTDSNGYARTAIHGFGLTSRHLMQKYPWYSCDSSSWVQASANGSIVLLDYNSPIPISENSPVKHSYGRHFDTMPTVAQVRIEEALVAQCGITIEQCRLDYKARWAVCAHTFDALGDALGEDHWRKPFKRSSRGLFG